MDAAAHSPVAAALARYGPLAQMLGMVIMIFGLSLLFPLAVSHGLGDGAEEAYDEALALTIGAGALVWLASRRATGELQLREGFLLVVLAWTVLAGFATLPLMIYLPELSFTDAYFETISGMTTTGATTLTGLDRLPPSINLWRCQLQWIGGLGIIVLAVAILPLLGVGGAQVFRAEAPGPMKDTKLTPRITETAKGLWTAYFVATILCVAAYRWAGMTWIDAVSHAFSTLSLGGFSPHDASFGYFDSPRIELVSIAFMLFASVNFATHFLAWRKRSLAAYARDPEAFAVLGVMLGSVVLVALFLWWRDFYPAFGQALRFAAFNTISAASTTGYASTDYDQWPVFAPVWLLFLSMWASSSGSTGGGIKMVRALLLIKQARREFTRILHPRAQLTVKLRGNPVESNIMFAVLAFMLVYGGSVIVTTFALAATGLDIITAFSAIMASINNLGPGLGKVGPAQNFAVLTDLQTWICSFTMLLGRLELFTLLVVFTPGFWRK